MENKKEETDNESEKMKLEDDSKEFNKSVSNKNSVKYVDVRIIALFIVGILFGFVIKTQAVKTSVIGAKDPQLNKTRGDYLFTQLEDVKDENSVDQEGAGLVEESIEDEVDLTEEEAEME